MTQCCLSLILLFYVKEDYNSRSVDDKDDTDILCKGLQQRSVDIRMTALPHPHPSILCKGRLQPQEG